MKKPTIKTMEVPNEEILVFHVSEKISENLSGYLTLPLLTLQPLTEKQKDMMTLILKLKGVVQVSIDQYQVSVGKAELFKWKDLINPITEIIKNQFPNDVDQHLRIIQDFNKDLQKKD